MYVKPKSYSNCKLVFEEKKYQTYFRQLAALKTICPAAIFRGLP